MCWLNMTREYSWIIHGQQECRSVINKCVDCQKAFKRPLEQKMDVLPDYRVEKGSPFSAVGLDMMGPFKVKIAHSRAVHKIWAVVFACMKTRSVHIEVVHKMDADSLLMAITCFSARRPGSSHFYSDNGTNLTKADKKLKKELKSWNESAKDTLIAKGIEWNFIPARAPHRGGAWERVIGLCKKHVKAMAFGHIPNVKTFETMLIQIEGILNRRPLTALSASAEDCEPLTPAHILYPGYADRQSHIYVTPESATAGSLRSRFLRSQALVNSFWKSWSRDYLSMLHARQKWHKTTEDLKKGELVLIVDPSLSRGNWRLARVVQPIVTGSHVRKARVRTADSKV
jgi:hypothetical protein